jgi:hypothetical protein
LARSARILSIRFVAAVFSAAGVGGVSFALPRRDALPEPAGEYFAHADVDLGERIADRRSDLVDRLRRDQRGALVVLIDHREAVLGEHAFDEGITRWQDDRGVDRVSDEIVVEGLDAGRASAGNDHGHDGLRVAAGHGHRQAQRRDLAIQLVDEHVALRSVGIAGVRCGERVRLALGTRPRIVGLRVGSCGYGGALRRRGDFAGELRRHLRDLEGLLAQRHAPAALRRIVVGGGDVEAELAGV